MKQIAPVLPILTVLALVSAWTSAPQSEGMDKRADPIESFFAELHGEWKSALPLPDGGELAIKADFTPGPTPSSGTWRTLLRRGGEWHLHAQAFAWRDSSRTWSFAKVLEDGVSGTGLIRMKGEDHLVFEWDATRPDGTSHKRVLNLVRSAGQVTFTVQDANADPLRVELEVVYGRCEPAGGDSDG